VKREPTVAPDNSSRSAKSRKTAYGRVRKRAMTNACLLIFPTLKKARECCVGTLSQGGGPTMDDEIFDAQANRVQTISCASGVPPSATPACATGEGIARLQGTHPSRCSQAFSIEDVVAGFHHPPSALLFSFELVRNAFLDLDWALRFAGRGHARAVQGV
jgi:hypothetical protein